MQISIIIPTYRPGDYLWECLDSIRNQTYPAKDYEIIIVLNGCNEPYKRQIEDYKSQYLQGHNVVLVQTDTPGVSNARNMGLDVAKGEYISFMDDDDYVSESYLSELAKHAAPNVISFSNTIGFQTDEQGNKQFRNIYNVQRHYNERSPYGKQPYYKAKCFSGPCMKLFNKSIIGDRRFNCNFSNGEDTMFMFTISDKMQYVDFTSKDAIYYRRFRPGSATQSYPLSSRIPNCLNLAKEYTRLYLSNIRRYKFRFYITKIIGIVKTIIAG